MSCSRHPKHSGTKRRVTGDWSDFLGTTAEIASVSYTLPSGITAPDTPEKTTTTETNWYTGGTDGNEYEVEVEVTTNESPTRIEVHQVFIVVDDTCDC